MGDLAVDEEQYLDPLPVFSNYRNCLFTIELKSSDVQIENVQIEYFNGY